MAPVVDIGAFEEEMASHYPDIPWRSPLSISIAGDNGFTSRSFGCRICIAAYGMKGSDAVAFPKTVEEFHVHMREKHPRKVADA